MALAAHRWWLTGQMPHSRCTSTMASQQRAALHEPLEAAELHDVQARLGDAVVIVHADGDLAVAFHAGEGVDDDLAGHRDALLPQSNLKCR